MYVDDENSECVLTHGEWKEHKYIAKVKRPNGSYRYFYSEESYRQYLANQKGEGNFVLDFIGSLSNALVSSISLAVKKTVVKATVDNVVSSLRKNLLSDLEYDSSGKLHKYVKRVTLPNGKYRYFYSMEEYEDWVERQKYQENEPDFMKNIDEIDDAESIWGSLFNVNPNYYDTFYNYYADGNTSMFEEFNKWSLNCANCSVAYELRRRGYDVEAAAYKEENSHLSNTLKNVYKDPKVYKIKSSDNTFKVEKALKTQTPGSRGELDVEWKGGGGHSLAYEVQKNGNVVILDTQTKTYYSDSPLSNSTVGDSNYKSISDLESSIQKATFFRTDNLELNEGVLGYFVEAD